MVADVHSALAGYGSKLTPELIDGFNEIAAVELPDLLLDTRKPNHQSDEGSDVWRALEGKTIGIYLSEWS